MRYWITIGILALIMINEYRKYKYILTSTVLWPVMWFFALFALTQEDYYVVSWSTLAIIVVGYMLFCAAFRCRCAPFNVGDAVRSINYDIERNIGSLDILFGFAIVVVAIYLFLMRGQLSIFNFLASFSQLYRADVGITTGLKYVSFIPKCMMWYFAAVYATTLHDKSLKAYSRSLLIKIIILAVINLIILIPGFVRTDFLFTYLPVILNIAIISGAKDRTIMKVFGIAMIGFVALFVSFAMLKHSYRYEGGGKIYVLQRWMNSMNTLVVER